MNDDLARRAAAHGVRIEDGLPARDPGPPGVHDCARCGRPAESTQTSTLSIGPHITPVCHICEDCFRLSMTDAKEFFRPFREKYGEPDA